MQNKWEGLSELESVKLRHFLKAGEGDRGNERRKCSEERFSVFLGLTERTGSELWGKSKLER